MFSNVSNASSALPAQAWLLSGPASCFLFSFSFTIFLSFSITNIVVVLPFSLCVWSLGLCRKRFQKSTTHLDMFTYHMVGVDTVAVAVCAAYIYGYYANAVRMMFTVMQVYSNISNGQTIFHIFTCLDRYIAVVHPITYIRLKEKGGTREAKQSWSGYVQHIL
uniref:G-protein coupled receptors family 1 profile domain-containing protein n=1 Tax=Knipowitschia caucasica TaxID=637954 RepID=A0AAV2KPX0_KNICA